MAGAISLLRIGLGFLCILESHGQIIESSVQNKTVYVTENVELIWTYQLGAGITPLFESWKKLPETVIASRTAVDVYISLRYMYRTELFGQAGLRLKNVKSSDRGVYELFTVFSDGTSQTNNISVQVINPCDEDPNCVQTGGGAGEEITCSLLYIEVLNVCCHCNNGYARDGKTCADVDECEENPCRAGEICSTEDGGFTCRCPPQSSGVICEFQSTAREPPECRRRTCAQNACRNGGTCLDKVTSFLFCFVNGDYEFLGPGESCKTECPSECLTKNGYCRSRDMITGYECICEPGWEGDTCEVPATQGANVTAIPTWGLPENSTTAPVVTTAESGIVLQDDGVTETIDGTSAELHWCYGFRPSKQVIFEAWWFKQTGGDQVLVASRYPARNASVQSRYKGRVEVFGDADLLLKAVSPADVGTYQLFAAFSDASDPLWKDRHLVVYYPPTNMEVTSSLSATEGDQVTFQAHANSVPPPTYLWTKVNGSLPSDSVMNITTGTLTLPHATLNDSGTYRVIASNELGNLSGVTILTVQQAFKAPRPVNLGSPLHYVGLKPAFLITETPAAGGRSTPHVAMSTTETPAAGGRSTPRTVHSTRGGGRFTPHVVTAAVVPSVVLLVLAVLAAVLGYRWIRKRQSDKHPEERDFHSNLLELTEVHRPPLPLPPPVPARPQFLEYEVNPTDLRLKEQIGRGAFGVVFLASLKRVVDGLLTEQTVVVKTVHEDAGVEEIKNFIREVDTTINLRQHINLLGLVGCCTLSHPPYLVTEYMPYGDLKNFLLKCRKTTYVSQAGYVPADMAARSIQSDGALRDSMYDFKEKNVYQVAQQIANGMAYISQAGYVHGDLAARNVLVGEDLLVKIADFGLTTDIYERGYQRQDAEQRIPLRWMAPERLLREGRYTSKSDVWSFGVVMYEIATLGNVPYPGVERTVLMEELRSGYREPRPPGLKQDLYDMMLRCWQWEEDHRPEFHELYEELNAVVGSMAKDCEKPPSSSQEGQNEAADVAENLNDIPKLAPTTMQLHVTADVYNSESHEEIDSLTSSNEESSSEPVETKYINGYHSNNHIAVGFKVAQQNTLIESEDTNQSQMESSSPLGAAIMDTNNELPVSTNVQKNDRPMEGGYLPMASLPHYN